MDLCKWRILAITHVGCDQGAQSQDINGLHELADAAHVEIVAHRTLEVLEDVDRLVKEEQPNVVCVFCCRASLTNTAEETTPSKQVEDSALASSIVDILQHVEGLQLIYLDTGFSLRPSRHWLVEPPCVIHWPKDPGPSIASHFSHTFFATLKEPSASIFEAFAIASNACLAHSSEALAASSVPQMLPDYEPNIPNNSTIPLPVVPGLDLSQGLESAVPDWSHVRLLAPRAELRLMLCGGSSLVDKTRLSHLGQAIRGVLVLETRSLQLRCHQALEKPPALLPQGCLAVRCEGVTSSNVEIGLVMWGPPSVMNSPPLLEHALRHTLVADSLALQFRLPPPGVPPPVVRSCSAIAGGLPVVDTLAMTSLWAVQVLRALCQSPDSRLLSIMGVVGVGNTATTNFTSWDSERLHQLVAGINLRDYPPSAHAVAELRVLNGAAAQQESVKETKSRHHLQGYPVGAHLGPVVMDPMAMAEEEQASLDHSTATALMAATLGTSTTGGPLGMEMDSYLGPDTLQVHVPRGGSLLPGSRAMAVRPHQCSRSPLLECSEQEFMDDLLSFLTTHRGRQVDPARFPDAVLNGVVLDLFNLYREVVTRGGFKVGNGINWKGQVFSKMKNWTANNKQTGVGNALKRHYQNYLYEYELAHPQDVSGDVCHLCGQGPENGTDWIACDRCERWSHFSCDPRQALGHFKDYVSTGGRSYVCPSCSPGEGALGPLITGPP